MSIVTVAGTLENLGKTITGGIGAEIRAGGHLLVIPGMSHEQIRELAPQLFGKVVVSISSNADGIAPAADYTPSFAEIVAFVAAKFGKTPEVVRTWIAEVPAAKASKRAAA